MKQDELSEYLDEADQSVKNFIAFLLETFSEQIKHDHEPEVKLDYFGALMEIKLLSFEGVYQSQTQTEQGCNSEQALHTREHG